MGLVVAVPKQSHAIVWIVAKAVIKKVIKAIDLGIQRQQNKVIWLQNAQKAIENEMSKLKLDEVANWTEKQRKLYDDYYKELWKVKNALSTFQKVRKIAGRQLMLVEEYRQAWDLLRQDKNFTPQDIGEMERVYTGMLDESLKNIDQLMLVVNSFSTQMSDGKRLALIADADRQIENNLTDLRKYNDRNFRLSISRTSDADQAAVLRKLYGLQ